MKTTIKEQNCQLWAIFEGRFDTVVATTIQGEIAPLLQSTDKEIVLDCTALDYISSSGLRVFLQIRQHANAANQRVVVRNANSGILDIFRMTGFNRLFDFE